MKYGDVLKVVVSSVLDSIFFILFAQDTQKKADEVQTVTISSTGTRGSNRTVIDTPVPVDMIASSELTKAAQVSLDKALQFRVPSFNTVNTPVNDATTLLDPWEIRNMGPSRTLILINGKRKNLSSLLYVQFSPGRGETGQAREQREHEETSGMSARPLQKQNAGWFRFPLGAFECTVLWDGYIHHGYEGIFPNADPAEMARNLWSLWQFAEL